MKKVLVMILTAAFSILATIISFAGQWEQDSIGWKYRNNDGSYQVNLSEWINGKKYRFDENGYMKRNAIDDHGRPIDDNGVISYNGHVLEYTWRTDKNGRWYGADPNLDVWSYGRATGWSWISRVLIPLAYRERTFSSIPETSL